jgi:hypothetical protein
VLFGRTGLFNGPDNTAGEAAFAGVDDDDRRIVFDAIQQFYRRYMAQAVSLSMRQPVPARTSAEDTSLGSVGDGDAAAAAVAAVGSATDPQGTWRVTVHDPSSRLKLAMHQESKLALQGMLGAMVVLVGFAVWASGGMREVVRANPCEILGRARLVAGSRLGEELRRRAKENGMRQRGNDGEPLMVKLGWWEREEWRGGGRRWGIDIVDAPSMAVLREELGERRSGAAVGKDSTVPTVHVREGWI